MKQLLFFYLLFSSFSLIAQQPFSLEISSQTSLTRFSANPINKLKGGVYGGEIVYHQSADYDKHSWMKVLNLKSVDVIFNYKNMADVERVYAPVHREFGDSYALLAGITLPLISTKVFSLDASPSFGVLYANETWFTNANAIIGSHLNFASRIALVSDVPLSKQLNLIGGVDILHYSNAGARVPNNGMNIVSARIGLLHYFNQDKQIDKSQLRTNAAYKKHEFEFGVNIGRRGVYRSKKGLYKSGFYGGYNYRLSEILALGTGIDAVYYYSIYNPNNNLETYQSKATSFNRWRVGAALGPDLYLGKLAVMAKYGYFLYYDSLFPIKTYWTTGFKYKTNDWLSLQAKIYVHQTEADFLGFGFILTR